MMKIKKDWISNYIGSRTSDMQFRLSENIVQKGCTLCLFRLHLATQHSSPHLLRLQGPNTIVHLFPLSSLEITETPLRAEQYNSLFNIIICMQNNYFNFDYLYIIYNNTINLQTCETYICTLYEE